MVPGQSYSWLVFILAMWTVTSFSCHFFAKSFLQTFPGADNPVHLLVSTVVLTTTQLVFCAALTELSDGHSAEEIPAGNNRPEHFRRILMIVFHILATLATNGSMSVMYAASTFAIKLLEPMVSALAQRMFLRIQLPFMSYVSIPIVISGAVMFTGDPRQEWNIGLGSFLAFLSNVFIALRNVTIKSSQLANVNIQWKSRRKVGVFLFCCLFGLLIMMSAVAADLLKEIGFKQLCLVQLSSFFHVVYSYISLAVVLQHMSVMEHSLGNLGKRLLVIMLLYMVGSRTASLYNICGLLICSLGKLLYFWTQKKSKCMSFSVKTALPIAVITAIFFISIVVLPRYRFMSGRQQTSTYTNIFKSNYIGELHDKGNNSIGSDISQAVNFNLRDFLSLDLLIHQNEVNKLSPHLTLNHEVIEEAQRIHLNVFQSLIGHYQYAMLFGIAALENKGDPAISVGEIILLKKLGIKLIFYCTISSCDDKNLDYAKTLSTNYTDVELVILLQGGGNIIGYPSGDYRRSRAITRFRNFETIMFPQSVYLTNDTKHIEFCKEVYSSHSRLTFIYRDKTSFNIGKKLFHKVRSLLLPDMAFEIGFIPRFMAPTFDILWLRREDGESPNYDIPTDMEGYRVHISDWKKIWKTPKGRSVMEDIFLLTTNGFMFLQRGRVVITDRLHGHILSTLLVIPHVLIDPINHKLFNYHRDWTFGLNNVVMANSSTMAMEKAKELLAKFEGELPEVVGYFQST